MPAYTDQLKRLVNINSQPRRIISIVPSQTELLYHLGLDEEVVGITKFCIHPQEWFKNKTRVGGTKNINIEKVNFLKPGLIIANKEENTKADIEQLEKIAPVWISDIINLDDALQMIQLIGSIVNREFEAKEIIEKINAEFYALNQLVFSKTYKKQTCCYLIWQKPYMSVGRNTFIHSMIEKCGLQNIFFSATRYPEVSIDDLQQQQPNIIMLSSEPFPFKDKHLLELQNLLPNSKVVLVDGEMFSWYGSRLINAPNYFIKILQDL